MSASNEVWVWAETQASYRALCALGSELGGSVHAVWVGDAAGAQEVRGCGARSVLWAETPESGLFEEAVGAVVQAVVERRPAMLLCATTKRLRLAAARVAAAGGTRVVNDALRLWVEAGCGETDAKPCEGALDAAAGESGDTSAREPAAGTGGTAFMAEHLVYGGSAYSVERMEGAIAVVLAAESLLLSAQTDVAGVADVAAAPVEELPVCAGQESGITLVSRRSRERDVVNLAAARRVVSVGRGLGAQEDLALVERLAQVLDAEIGCTRPLAEGVNWLPRERYIGVSGAMLKPDVFMAVGVSGQIQHMVGASSAKTVIAINKDKNAPVFKQADYGLVGDLYDVVPQLVEAFAAGSK